MFLAPLVQNGLWRAMVECVLRVLKPLPYIGGQCAVQRDDEVGAGVGRARPCHAGPAVHVEHLPWRCRTYQYYYIIYNLILIFAMGFELSPDVFWIRGVFWLGPPAPTGAGSKIHLKSTSVAPV